MPITTIQDGLHDAFGNPIGSVDGAIDVHDADVHHVVVNEYFSRPTGVTTTLSSAASTGDRVISVVDASSFSAGDTMSIENGFTEAVFPLIVSIATNDITLNKPLDHNYDSGEDVDQLQTNLNVNGSVTPISFFIRSERQETWHVIRFLLGMVHASAADDSKFGSLTALTNGCVLRGYNATADSFRSFTFWRDNEDIKLDMFDLTYTDKAGGGAHGTNGRGSIKIGTGSSPRLTPSDYLELIIQDDLTGLTSFYLKAQGHIEGA